MALFQVIKIAETILAAYKFKYYEMSLKWMKL